MSDAGHHRAQSESSHVAEHTRAHAGRGFRTRQEAIYGWALRVYWLKFLAPERERPNDEMIERWRIALEKINKGEAELDSIGHSVRDFCHLQGPDVYHRATLYAQEKEAEQRKFLQEENARTSSSVPESSRAAIVTKRGEPKTFYEERTWRAALKWNLILNYLQETVPTQIQLPNGHFGAAYTRPDVNTLARWRDSLSKGELKKLGDTIRAWNRRQKLADPYNEAVRAVEPLLKAAEEAELERERVLAEQRGDHFVIAADETRQTPNAAHPLGLTQAELDDLWETWENEMRTAGTETEKSLQKRATRNLSQSQFFPQQRFRRFKVLCK